MKKLLKLRFDNKKARLLSSLKIAGLSLAGLMLLALALSPQIDSEGDQGQVKLLPESSDASLDTKQPLVNDGSVPSAEDTRSEPDSSVETTSQQVTVVDPGQSVDTVDQLPPASNNSQAVAVSGSSTNPDPVDDNQDDPDESVSSDNPLYLVNRVIDGDTIEVLIDDQAESLRLIGIDTPETVDPRQSVECFGLEAKAKADEILQGQRVYLEVDSSQDNRDRYGRLLRHVILVDGRNYGLEIIRQGYGHEYTHNQPHVYQAEFRQAEAEAREAERGLWAPGACVEQEPENGSTPVTEASDNNSDDTDGSTVGCHSAYEPCLEVVGDLNCGEIGMVVRVKEIGVDPYRLDRDRDGVGCESYG